jgi:hypothetical protein
MGSVALILDEKSDAPPRHKMHRSKLSVAPSQSWVKYTPKI